MLRAKEHKSFDLGGTHRRPNADKIISTHGIDDTHFCQGFRPSM